MKYFLMSIIFLFSISLIGQNNTHFLLLDQSFNAPLEISSACIFDKHLILASEKCGKIYTIDPNSGETIKTDELPIIKNRGIEGVSIFDNHYFFVDEKKKNQIFVVNRKTKKKLNIKYSSKFNFPDPKKNTNGVEGIEIDVQSGIIYVVCEGENQHYSDLFKIKIDKIKSNTIHLKLLNKLKIKKDNKYRYCALTFNDAKDLLLLRSCHGEYFIDRITKDKLNNNKVSYIDAEELIEISNSVNNKSGNFSTNLEGMAYLNGYVIIVSDNSGSISCGNLNNKKGKGTILMKTKL